MVDDQVHDNSDPQAMGCRQHTVEIRHGAEISHDISVIGNIISIIIIRGGIDRAEPDDIDPKLLQIGEMLCDPVQIPDPVSVAVREGPGIDLIDDRFFPPGTFFFCHLFILLCSVL